MDSQYCENAKILVIRILYRDKSILNYGVLIILITTIILKIILQKVYSYNVSSYKFTEK